MPTRPKFVPRRTLPIEREYFRHLLKYVALYRALVRGELLPVLPALLEQMRESRPATLRRDSLRMDASVNETLNNIFDRVRTRLAKAMGKKRIKRWNEIMVERVNELSKANAAGALRKASDAEIQPLLTDKGLNPFFKEYVSQNVNMVQSIETEDHEKLKKLISTSIAKDMTVRDIGKQLEEHFGVTKRKAAMLARDQVNRLNGQLDQHRQAQMGVTRYVWRTMEDDRVRPKHADQDGKTHSWDNPPKVGAKGERFHPTQDYNCRCYAEPVLDDILD